MNEGIEQLLSRGIAEVHVKEDLRQRLQSGKKLRVKFGIDPTGSELHLGHLVPLRKLAEFQKLGHQIILLFGTFTGKIGDPTGKDKLRQPLSDEQIEHNMETYLEQAGKVLDVENIEIVKNGDWLSEMKFSDILELAGTFTASQMMQRDMFQERLKKELDINLVEFFYPLMQGYDSVAIKADVEIGGTDQLFNLMAGRKIQERYGQKPQDILTVPILEGTAGVEKMSKSLNNYIGVMEPAREIFGKTMSLPDDLMPKYYQLLTSIPTQEVEMILGGHPRDAKLRLATEITAMLHSESEAKAAHDEFHRMFSQKELPDEIPRIAVTEGEHSLLDLVIHSGLCASNSDARRMIQQGGVKLDGEKQDDMSLVVRIGSQGMILQVGKRKFIEIKRK